MSKGSNRRPEDAEKYAAGWDRIFGKPTLDTLKKAVAQMKTLEPYPTVDIDGAPHYEFVIKPKDANIHPACAEPFCSCVDRCIQMEPIDAGDLHK